MHKSKILTILALAALAPLGFAFTPSLLSTYKNGSQTGEALSESESDDQNNNMNENYKKFSDEIQKLDLQLSKVSNLNDRIKYLHSRLDDLVKERANWSYGRVEDEIAMDTIIAILREIPRGEEFNTEECPNYRLNIFIKNEPTTSSLEEPKDPAAKLAFQLFKKVCS